MSKLDPRNRPTVMKPQRAAAQARPQGSPVSTHATPRNRALAIGTDPSGFPKPVDYNYQGGAPLTATAGRDFADEQRARDDRYVETAKQVGSAPASGFRFKAE